MNAGLDARLVREHPFLFTDRFADMRNTAMCWGFECGDGWYKLIKEAADKLEPLVKQYASDHPLNPSQPRASQVKEKFGTLRFYMSCSTEQMEKIIEKAERKSAVTCEQCGKRGKLRGRGWLYTACAKHTREEDR